jgi:ferredoxin/bacterioferritin-associated ferredoxin
MDLSVGVFGGEGLRVQGVLPLASGSGGVAVVEDSQGRIHRIEARSIIRVVEPLELPDPFSGWLSPGLLPLGTALKLRERGQTIWSPAVAVLGSGNRALSLACELLESGVPEVFCIEKPGQAVSGWEVLRRRFETLGGVILYGKPVSLTKAARMLWDFRIQDAHGIRVLEVAWVISAGPFRGSEGVREYPPGSLLFELDQSGAGLVAEDPEGWALEEHRGRALGARICKALIASWGDRRVKKDRLEEELRRARGRLKRAMKRAEGAVSLEFEGKWLSRDSSQKLRGFSGAPRAEHASRMVASIECVEEIECSLCQSACPEEAIQISREAARFLDESKCTACGKCLDLCPAKVPVLIHEPEGRSQAKLTLSFRGRRPFRTHELASLVNRRGEVLGSGKVLESIEVLPASEGVGAVAEYRVTLEVPAHLVWEARGLRSARQGPSHEEEWVMSSERAGASKVEVLLQNERRLLRDGQPLGLALFETGLARTEDRLLCGDGSCGLCDALVDGVQRPACRTSVHRGMAVQLEGSRWEFALSEVAPNGLSADSDWICPCSAVTRQEVSTRIREGKLSSADAIRQSCGVGEGRCRGRICHELFRRTLLVEGVDADQWIDWRFPWSEWTLKAT